MGDPKKSRKTYSRPLHPWQGDRIKRENELQRKYGLKNKKEIWKAQSILKKWRVLARDQAALIRAGNKQAEKESADLLKRLVKLGILGEKSRFYHILALDVESVLARRLQTVVYEKGLAHTMKQSRQFITHGHIAVRGRTVTVPSYLVPISDGSLIDYCKRSPLNGDEHPMRPGTDIFDKRKAREEAAKKRKRRRRY